MPQMPEVFESQDKAARTEIAKSIRLRLGEGMIDIEPDPEHINEGIDLAFQRYRQRSSNSLEESYMFLEIQADQQTYTLPKEIQDVREIYRRGVAGLATGGGSYIDPFNLAYTNLYLLRSGDVGGLATYDFFSQYQETVGRLFGLYLNYHYDRVSRTLTIHRKPTNSESILLRTYNEKPESHIWNDAMVKPWIKEYALAEVKLMIAEARGLFSQIPGPGGGTTLNGNELKADAQQSIEKLDEELKNLVDGQEPMYFVIG